METIQRAPVRLDLSWVPWCRFGGAFWNGECRPCGKTSMKLGKRGSILALKHHHDLNRNYCLNKLRHCYRNRSCKFGVTLTLLACGWGTLITNPWMKYENGVCWKDFEVYDAVRLTGDEVYLGKESTGVFLIMICSKTCRRPPSMVTDPLVGWTILH